MRWAQRMLSAQIVEILGWKPVSLAYYQLEYEARDLRIMSKDAAAKMRKFMWYMVRSPVWCMLYEVGK